MENGQHPETPPISLEEAAEALDVHRSTISLALNTATPSRYAATLARITEHFTDYQIESETVTIHRAKHKGKTW